MEEEKKKEFPALLDSASGALEIKLTKGRLRGEKAYTFYLMLVLLHETGGFIEVKTPKK